MISIASAERLPDMITNIQNEKKIIPKKAISHNLFRIF